MNEFEYLYNLQNYNISKAGFSNLKVILMESLTKADKNEFLKYEHVENQKEESLKKEYVI